MSLIIINIELIVKIHTNSDGNLAIKSNVLEISENRDLSFRVFFKC